MNRELITKKLLAKRELKIRKARASFWEFCKLIHDYKEEWTYLKIFCNNLQAFYENKLMNEGKKPYKKFMVNMPPRHFKTRTLVLYSCWVFGKDPKHKIIASSYSDDLATTFSRHTRDEISLAKNKPLEIVYNDIFPKTTIKQGDASYKEWTLKGTHFSYKGCGFGSSITGKGANLTIIDDQVKNYEEAVNEMALEKKWEWYTGTWLSRLEEGAKQIICMTRWSDNDICGRLLADKFEQNQWYQLKFEAYDKETNEMLSDEMLSKDSYEEKKRMIQEEIFYANYHQRTINKKGALYQKFKTYNELLKDDKNNVLQHRRIAYIDTADQGNDFLCAICGIEYNKEFYCLDILYTKEPQEVTEIKTADMLIKHDIRDCTVESNAGGRAFARNVERLVKEKGVYTIRFKWHHQSQNKLARILTNASNVEDRVYWQNGWNYRYPEFYQSIKTFMRSKNNKNDDSVDTITGIIEMMDNKHVLSVSKVSAGALGL